MSEAWRRDDESGSAPFLFCLEWEVTWKDVESRRSNPPRQRLMDDVTAPVGSVLAEIHTVEIVELKYACLPLASFVTRAYLLSKGCRLTTKTLPKSHVRSSKSSIMTATALAPPWPRTAQ